MELEWPGVEKKKRWEAKTVAKSGGGGEWSVSSESSEEEEKNSVMVEEVREVECWVSDEVRLYKELKFFMIIDEDVEREGWL